MVPIYFIAKNIVEMPVVVIECIVYSVILYWMTGLNSEFHRFVYFVAMLTQYDTLLYCVLDKFNNVNRVDFFSVNFCRLLSSLLPTEQVSAIVAPASYQIQLLFLLFRFDSK